MAEHIFLRTIVMHKSEYFIQLLIIGIFCLGVCNEAFPQKNNKPKFGDYAVSEIYRGRNAPLRLTREDRTFRTRLKWAVNNQKPNFAGRYIITSWGCGAGCIVGAAIDAKTGKVSWWGFSLCCWSGEDEDVAGFSFRGNLVEFRKDSRLIAFYGVRNEEEGDHGIHYYKIENGRFVHLRSIRVPERE